MATIVSMYNNAGRYEIEGSFDLSATGTVSAITSGLDSLTCRGQGLTCTGTVGTYSVVLKNPGVQLVQLLKADASLMSLTLGVALSARVTAVSQSSSTGDITITVVTAQTTGAVATTTAAITVGFVVVIATTRMDRVL